MIYEFKSVHSDFCSFIIFGNSLTPVETLRSVALLVFGLGCDKHGLRYSKYFSIFKIRDLAPPWLMCLCKFQPNFSCVLFLGNFVVRTVNIRGVTLKLPFLFEGKIWCRLIIIFRNVSKSGIWPHPGLYVFASFNVICLLLYL